MGRSGVTLVEIMVALAVLALLNGSAVLAIRSLRRPDSASRAELIALAQRSAVTSGRPVQFVAGADTVLFLPDGRAIGLVAAVTEGGTRGSSR